MPAFCTAASWVSIAAWWPKSSGTVTEHLSSGRLHRHQNIWKRSPEDVVRFYNGRGTAEQWIKEGKNAVKWTKLSCSRFKDNQTWVAVVRAGLQPGHTSSGVWPCHQRSATGRSPRCGRSW